MQTRRDERFVFELAVDARRGLLYCVGKRFAGLATQERIAPAEQIIRQKLVNRGCDCSLAAGMIALPRRSSIKDETSDQTGDQRYSGEHHPRGARAGFGK